MKHQLAGDLLIGAAMFAAFASKLRLPGFLLSGSGDIALIVDSSNKALGELALFGTQEVATIFGDTRLS